ncbi:MAG: hypothetical protein ABFS42_04905, partial [Candidatus Krumholzibacteriota bacterium]
MNALSYLGNHILYHWIFLVLMAPIVIVAIILRFLFESFGPAGSVQVILRLDIFLAFVWIIFSGYVGHRAARNRVIKGMGFVEARERAWLDTKA